ncbi:hypothetical protein E4631_23650 [Hymenobacter sp. UV11]|uniref:hypothetical protein n=1 Tax=Hymenobacter sp. UV11 TaxID=1849735 RepID=UPI00105E761B|nr:hypothetical protein [Hymenobacter sp. UV11]TDN38119.1 hypothetical protein A8B98_25290 [Hymenobacter sp. UV11]TFZ63142.1 hypothetical protein E4631_23650 [Hymenobacter sp. UV11]
MKTLLASPFEVNAQAYRPAPTPLASAQSAVAEALCVLHRVNPALSYTGWLHVGLTVAALALLPLDQRHVTGALVWLKPLKFALSGLAYTWTLAWLLADLPAPAQRSVRRLSGAVALSMVVEIVIIFMQAGRGVSSHYNVSSPVNGLLFSLMGIFILVNTAMTIWAVYLAWRYRPHGSAGYVWGLRLGLLVFLVGSALGGFMIHQMQHTVGAPDGGPGLPGLGWSTVAGDVRTAHFLGMHALQALPLLGWALGRRVPRRAALLTGVGAALYVAAVAGLLAQALAGRPLL